jgi:hypothetical protein
MNKSSLGVAGSLIQASQTGETTGQYGSHGFLIGSDEVMKLGTEPIPVADFIKRSVPMHRWASVRIALAGTSLSALYGSSY